MAPTGFQGLVNKWVKISSRGANRDVYDTEWSKPYYRDSKRYEDYSTRTAETSTIDSSLVFQNQQRNEPEQVVTADYNRPTSLGRKSSTKKLTKSNSYTDLLRRKKEEFLKDYPAQDLQLNIPSLQQQLDNTDEHVGVSIEQLFNPLTTTTHVEDILRKDSVVDAKGYSSEKLNALESTCESCGLIHEKVQDYIELTKFLQSNHSILPSEKCNEVISVATGEVESLKVENDDDVESGLPLTEISCDSAFMRKSATQSTSSPVPIQHEACQSSHYVEESIALMESSRRLFEFMNLHKKRMAQLNQERNDWQENLDSKLSQFTAMCQSIRQEIVSTESETKNQNKSNNALNMLAELEAQIGELKSEQNMNYSAPVRVYQNPHGDLARHASLLQNDKVLLPGSPPENLNCTFTNMHNYVNSPNHRRPSDSSTLSDLISSISDSSHSASIQDDFMFSLDDD